VNNNQANATIYTPHGTVIVPPQQDPHTQGSYTVQDSNGNVITITNSSSGTTTFTDTLGTTVLTVTTTWVGWNSSPNQYDTYTFPAPNGGTSSVQVNYSLYNLKTNFGIPNIQDFPDIYSGNILLVSEIDMPDIATNPNDKYAFTYEPTPGYPGYVTGRIATVTLPMGGSIGYNYWGGTGNVNGIFADGTTAAFTRTLNDGTTSTEGTFWIAQNVNGTGTSETHVTSPSGNETVFSFTGNYETQRQIWQGPASAGQGLETILTCWNGVSSGTCGPGATVTPPIQDRVQYTELPSTASRHDEYFNGNGLLTETDDYDWGYAFLRKQLITYASLGNNILDRPSSLTVQDASGNTLSQTNYYYDQWALWTPPGTTPQQVAVSGDRGNMTEEQVWTGSTWLYHTFDYYNTGTVHDNRDVNGQPTYYNYADANSTCGNAFPTSITPPQGTSGVDLTSATAYDCNGGVAVSATDPNGRTVATTGWDPYFWRAIAVTDQSMGYTKLYSYTPTTVDTHWGLNTTSTVHTKTTVDGLGRPHVSQREQGYNSPNFDSVETDYDADGRPYRTTVGYVGTAGQANPSAAATTTNYDALGRPLHAQDPGGGTIDYNYYNNDVLITTGSPNTQRQYEYDALGRLTSVCEITSAAGSGTCGQSRAQTGYWTKYTYDTAIINSVVYTRTTVTQSAQAPAAQQQTRSFLYDALRRLVQETNPETGTKTYVYDSGGGCGGTFTGDLVSITDAAGNTICYSYDALHRLTQTLYYGSAASVTPARSFVYDAGTLNGQTMHNAKGRLAYAFNCFSSCATVPSILFFSYSPRGEITDTWEQTEHSGGYYHTTASYWSHGPMQNLNLYAPQNTPLIPTITYGAPDASGLDVEGRITKVTASSGQSPVTAATYVTSGTSQPIGALTNVLFGSGDSDQFSYDPNTGRMTQYSSSVFGVTNTGTLTWNANGSLQRLQIANNSTQDYENCRYTHDDLGRIASVNCGENNSSGPFIPWTQNFSYDPFGNITKRANTGIGGFLATYDQTTNHIVPTTPYDSYNYDSNGNLLTDSADGHQYSWDAEGRPVTIDSVTLIYDAMGRMVEQVRNGDTNCSTAADCTQIIYGPGGGKLALTSGQTLSKAFVPLPGGATAVYGSTNPNPAFPNITLLYYRHADWQGSSRLGSTAFEGIFSSTQYAPFGENYNGTDATDLSFTGQNQDTVHGLYDFMYREYSPNQGRWISPDPAGVRAMNLDNPQSLNRYAYALNNPTLVTDPDGLYPQDQHGFLSFLLLTLAGNSHAAGIAAWAYNADNFRYAATGLLGFGVFINNSIHFGRPITSLDGFSDRKAGFALHTIEDNWPGNSPHQIIKGYGLGERIANVFAHVGLTLFGTDPDRDPKRGGGFQGAWQVMGGTGSAPMVEQIRNTVNSQGLDITEMAIWGNVNGKVVSVYASTDKTTGLDVSGDALLGSSIVWVNGQSWTLNIWKQPGNQNFYDDANVQQIMRNFALPFSDPMAEAEAIYLYSVYGASGGGMECACADLMWTR
jgi:RHS repeat-associated protein